MKWRVGTKNNVRAVVEVTKVDPLDKKLSHYVTIHIGSAELSGWMFDNEMKEIFGVPPKKKATPKKKAVKKVSKK